MGVLVDKDVNDKENYFNNTIHWDSVIFGTIFYRWK